MTYVPYPHQALPGAAFWANVARAVLQRPPRTDVEILVPVDCHPSRLGSFQRDIGLGDAPGGHWRANIEAYPQDRRGLHVRDQDGARMLVHWDEVTPLGSLEARVEHARVDAPTVYAVGAGLLGAAIGHAIEPKGGALKGLLAGLGIGVATLPAVVPPVVGPSG